MMSKDPPGSVTSHASCQHGGSLFELDAALSHDAPVVLQSNAFGQVIGLPS